MTDDGIKPAWIAVDWGTSNLRAWAMDATGRPVAEASSREGMGGLSREGFEPALLELIGGWLEEGRRTEVVACGMVGARQGWVEAPYAPVPCRAAPGAFARPEVSDARIAVHILPGLSQAAPPDVMRGEETKVSGLLARERDFDGVVCLPGTHTKWVHVSAGEVVSFASFMTGELFALLSRQSVLRHSVGAEGWSDADFAEAVEEGMARPERLASRLFGLRAESLLAGLAPERARARLSGLLVGAELAGARPYWLGRDVVLSGAAVLVASYGAALRLCGLEPRVLDATEMTLAGLAAGYAELERSRT